MDNLQTLRRALERLSEAEKLMSIAIDRGMLPNIDRDLILEKIRWVYDALLFENPYDAPVGIQPKLVSALEAPAAQRMAEPVTLSDAEKVSIEPEQPQPQPPFQTQPQPGEILADKFKDKRKFRNESIGVERKDVSTKLQNKPISDLTKSIGINDKFLYTKELFGGNAELYKRTLKVLNEFTNINDAIIYLQENFHWGESNEAASQLVELVRRKLLTN